MKMQELLSTLEAEGIHVTKRMVRHYIEIGLLPKPFKLYNNQATYLHIHLNDLRIIDMYKKIGLPLEMIKIKMNSIYKYVEQFRQDYDEDCDFDMFGEEEYNDNWGAFASDSSYHFFYETSMLEVMYFFLTKDIKFYSKEELLTETNLSEEKLNYIITKFLKTDKELYDSIDLYLIKTINIYIDFNNIDKIWDNDQDIEVNFNDLDLHCVEEIEDIKHSVRKLIQLGNKNPLINLVFKSLMVANAKDSLMNNEINNFIWDELVFDNEFKNKYISKKGE